MKEQRALIGNIQKFSTEDGPGIRTTVFFKGCPLRCLWCHNPEMIEPRQELIQSPNNCIGCGSCIKACPQNAITVQKVDVPDAPAGACASAEAPAKDPAADQTAVADQTAPVAGTIAGTPDRDPAADQTTPASAGTIAIDRTRCDLCMKCTQVCYAQALRPVAKLMTASEIAEEVAADKGFYDNTGGGVTLSGGEVLMHADFARRLIEILGEQGIGVCLDTCGYGDPEALRVLARMENVTNILYDMKALDDEVHQAYTGVSNRRIIENLRLLADDPATKNKIILRMPLIRGVNDDPDMIKRTGTLCRKLGLGRIDLLPYHDLGVAKARNVGGTQQTFAPPTDERMAEIRQILGIGE